MPVYTCLERLARKVVPWVTWALALLLSNLHEWAFFREEKRLLVCKVFFLLFRSFLLDKKSGNGCTLGGNDKSRMNCRHYFTSFAVVGVWKNANSAPLLEGEKEISCECKKYRRSSGRMEVNSPSRRVTFGNEKNYTDPQDRFLINSKMKHYISVDQDVPGPDHNLKPLG